MLIIRFFKTNLISDFKLVNLFYSCSKITNRGLRGKTYLDLGGFILGDFGEGGGVEWSTILEQFQAIKPYTMFYREFVYSMEPCDCQKAPFGQRMKHFNLILTQGTFCSPRG